MEVSLSQLPPRWAELREALGGVSGPQLSAVARWDCKMWERNMERTPFNYRFFMILPIVKDYVL